MIHVNSITAALESLLANDPVLASSGFTVSEGMPYNQDLNRTPWIGIYHGSLRMEPHTLGGGQPWLAEVELHLYVQQAGFQGDGTISRALNQAQSRVFDVLAANATLLGSVAQVSGFESTPFQRDMAEESWMFSNEITLRAQVRG